MRHASQRLPPSASIARKRIDPTNLRALGELGGSILFRLVRSAVSSLVSSTFEKDDPVRIVGAPIGGAVSTYVKSSRRAGGFQKSAKLASGDADSAHGCAHLTENRVVRAKPAEKPESNRPRFPAKTADARILSEYRGACSRTFQEAWGFMARR
jgi:hypothetical protein